MRLALTLAICTLFSSSVTAHSAQPPKTALDQKQIEQLVAALGNSDYQERERATKELGAAGLAALPRLRVAARTADLEVVRRAKICIEQIERNDPGGGRY